MIFTTLFPVLVVLLFYLVHSKFVHFSINSVYAHHYLLDNAWKLMLFLVYEASLARWRR